MLAPLTARTPRLSLTACSPPAPLEPEGPPRPPRRSDSPPLPRRCCWPPRASRPGLSASDPGQSSSRLDGAGSLRPSTAELLLCCGMPTPCGQPGVSAGPADPSHPAPGDSGEADSEGGLDFPAGGPALPPAGQASGSPSESPAPTAGAPPLAAGSSGRGEVLLGAGGGESAASLAGGRDCSPLPCGSGWLLPEPADALTAALHEDTDAAEGAAVVEEEWQADYDPTALPALAGLGAQARDGCVHGIPQHGKPRDSTTVEVEDGDGMTGYFGPVPPLVAVDPALAVTAAGAGAAQVDPDAVESQGASNYPIPDAQVAALYEVFLRCTLQVRARGLDEADRLWMKGYLWKGYA